MQWKKAMPEKMPRSVKYTWAALLSVAVGALTVSDRGSVWRPVLHHLIDAIQREMDNGMQPLPGAGHIPAGTGPLNLPPREEVLPAAPDFSTTTPSDMATGD
jgi:hypothetical protein